MQVLALFLSHPACRAGRICVVGPAESGTPACRENVSVGPFFEVFPAMAEELKVISDLYDFTLWLVRHVEKYPRHHRYSLGRDIEARLQSILGLLLRAKYSRDQKAALLADANIELEVLRFQVRLSKDLKCLAAGSHGHAAKVINEIGKQIGGWHGKACGKR